MSGFQFRLAAVLSLRVNARESYRVQLAAACLTEQHLLDARRVVQQEFEQQRSCREQMAGGPLDVDRLAQIHRYERTLEVKLRALDQQLTTAMAEISAHRQALQTADGEVRALEKLRDLHQERFRRQQTVLETKALDEIAGRQCQTTERP